MSKIYESIEAKEKICIVGLSTKKLYDIAKTFDNKKIKYLLHTRDSDDELKNKLVDVNKLWSAYDIVMFSPTISCGVDFNLNHFDKIYSIITSGTCDSRLYMQMLGRVRKLNNNNILTFYDNMSSKQNKMLYEFDDVYDYYKYVSTDKFIEREIITENNKLCFCNKIKICEKIMIYNQIINLNKSSEYFMTQLNICCGESNYELAFDESNVIKKEIEISDDAYKNKILSAKDITYEESIDIEKRINNCEATENDKFSYQKYIFKKTWKLNEVTQENLNTYFRKEQTLYNHKYLFNSYNGVINDVMKKKKKVIDVIIDVLGFDITKLDTLLKDDVMKINIEMLNKNVNFSKNYNLNRILFERPKTKTLKLGLKIVNGFLAHFGMSINRINKQKRINGKQINNKLFILSINNNYSK
jgi:hypothetical protein